MEEYEKKIKELQKKIDEKQMDRSDFINRIEKEKDKVLKKYSSLEEEKRKYYDSVLLLKKKISCLEREMEEKEKYTERIEIQYNEKIKLMEEGFYEEKIIMEREIKRLKEEDDVKINILFSL